MSKTVLNLLEPISLSERKTAVHRIAAVKVLSEQQYVELFQTQYKVGCGRSLRVQELQDSYTVQISTECYDYNIVDRLHTVDDDDA